MKGFVNIMIVDIEQEVIVESWMQVLIERLSLGLNERSIDGTNDIVDSLLDG